MRMRSDYSRPIVIKYHGQRDLTAKSQREAMQHLSASQASSTSAPSDLDAGQTSSSLFGQNSGPHDEPETPAATSTTSQRRLPLEDIDAYAKGFAVLRQMARTGFAALRSDLLAQSDDLEDDVAEAGDDAGAAADLDEPEVLYAV
jgi:hypothetical protein